jgi:Flp pilus assembly protein TadD
VLPRAGLALAALLALASCDFSGSQQVGFQSRIDVGARMLQSGQHASGYRLLDQVAAEHAGSAEAGLAIAAAYLDARAFAKAENAYTSAARSGAGPRAVVGLGRVALARNAPDQAMRHFSAVLEKDPGNLAAINGMGVAHDLKGQHATARAEYNRVLTIDPTHVDALNNLALSNVLGGSGETAVAILQDLTGSQVNDPTLRQNLAIALAVTGRRQDAVRLATADITEGQAEAIFQLVSTYRRSRS